MIQQEPLKVLFSFLGPKDSFTCCLENSTDRGAKWAIVHGVAKSHARLREEDTLTHTPRTHTLHARITQCTSHIDTERRGHRAHSMHHRHHEHAHPHAHATHASKSKQLPQRAQATRTSVRRRTEQLSQKRTVGAQSPLLLCSVFSSSFFVPGWNFCGTGRVALK